MARTKKHQKAPKAGWEGRWKSTYTTTTQRQDRRNTKAPKSTTKGSTVVAYRRNEDTVTKGTKKHQLDAFWYIQVFLGLVWNHGQNEKAQKAPKNTESARGGKDGGDLQTKP